MHPRYIDGLPSSNEQPDLSVIVPFYNEEDNLVRMHAAIVNAMEPIGMSFEMVFVDDGSRDRTLERAVEVARTDSRLRVVKFRRNYGQTPAMAAGIEQARGKVLVTMDGDLQNDPADIAHFLAKIDEGNDIVVGWRHDRQDKLISRKIPSRIANWLIGKVTGVPIKDNGCSLKAYRAALIKEIPLYSEMHRFIPAMASIAGPRIAEIKVRHHARQFGKSKYGLSRVYKVLLGPDGHQDCRLIHRQAAPLVHAACVAASGAWPFCNRLLTADLARNSGSDAVADCRNWRDPGIWSADPGQRRRARRVDLQAGRPARATVLALD